MGIQEPDDVGEGAMAAHSGTNYHLVMTNIAMENLYKWRFLAGKIIYQWAIYTMAMLNNQRVL
jgi:hypothetical protein